MFNLKDKTHHLSCPVTLNTDLDQVSLINNLIKVCLDFKHVIHYFIWS